MFVQIFLRSQERERVWLIRLHVPPFDPDNFIGPDGAQALAAVLPRTRLTDLNIRQNRLEDEGVCAIAAVLPHLALRQLNLDRSLSIFSAPRHVTPCCD